ncbi:RHS repeat-associated core domain-containing protein [Dactylosporangium sp. NPDC049140]|uniref:RHS repeat protein n=1 Tax=Dactylosporangium sp. NPDC049140 TaxID=3155647 RepID=UPI0033D3555C
MAIHDQVQRLATTKRDERWVGLSARDLRHERKRDRARYAACRMPARSPYRSEIGDVAVHGEGVHSVEEPFEEIAKIRGDDSDAVVGAAVDAADVAGILEPEDPAIGHRDGIQVTTAVAAEDNSDTILSATHETTESGAPRNASDIGNLRYGWLGDAERAADTPGGVLLMGARLYNPITGRFLQVDPVPGGSANRYDYCFGDPVNCRDLDGKIAIADDILIGIIIVIVILIYLLIIHPITGKWPSWHWPWHAKESRKSGKEKGNDGRPTWAKKGVPNRIGKETSQEATDRQYKENDRPIPQDKGPGTEWARFRKFIDRRPRLPANPNHGKGF